jgi:hypothetical protein
MLQFIPSSCKSGTTASDSNVIRENIYSINPPLAILYVWKEFTELYQLTG